MFGVHVHVANATPSRKSQPRASWFDWLLRIAAGGALLAAILMGAL